MISNNTDIIHKIYDDINLNEGSILKLDRMWKEPWRFYHTIEHLHDLIFKISNLDIDSLDKNILYEAAIFHDCVYNPWSKTNEEDSVYFYEQVTNPKKIVIDIIIDTSKRECPEDKLSSIFWKLDNSILESDIEGLLIYEKKIMKEFQFINYSEYKKGRIEFLKSCLNKFDNDDNILFLINYVKNFRPKIAFYPGSFNPLHIGHMSIIKKCDKIFDKVIIGIGNNPNKKSMNNVKKSIKSRELVQYDCLTTEIIKKLSIDSDIILVRGIRNSTDLLYENDQLKWMEKLSDNDNNIDIVYIPCDEEYNHISSSSLRNIINSGYLDKVKEYLI